VGRCADHVWAVSAAASTHRALAAASIAALLLCALVASAGGAGHGVRDNEPPSSPAGIRVTSSTSSAVALAWTPSTDNVEVTSYEVSGEIRRSRVKDTQITVDRLDCGESLSVWITAMDRAGNRSTPSQATVSTAACPDVTPPSPPDGFRQSTTSQTAVILLWDPSADDRGVVGYGLYRTGIPYASASEPATTLAGLACGSTYELAVDAYDAAGNRSERRSAWISTSPCSPPPPPPPGDTTPPSQPAGLTVSSATQTSASLTWTASTDNHGVTGYGVYRDNALVSTVSQPGTSVSELTCGTGYTFAVDAVDAAGNRSPKASVSGTTASCSSPPPPPPPPPPGDTTAPSQPSGLAISAATQVSATLTWIGSTDNTGVTGYGVYRNGALVSTASLPGASVAGLTCGTAYAFAVDAVDAAGNRSTKASVTGTTAACADTQAPSAPTGVQASSRTATSIGLSWSASSDNVGVTGYALYKAGALASTTTATSGVLSGLTCNTNYTLAVDAVDAAGNRSAKTTLMVATTACPDTTPPSTPTGLSASGATQTGLTLAWNAASDNVGVTGYDLYAQGTKVGSSTGTTYTFGNLSCGTTYSVGVVALDAAGNRSSQSSVTSSTSACSAPPPPPSGVQYPASYFTGPLGTKNPVPTKRGTFLITWLGMPGGATTWTQVRDRVLQRERDMGRKYDGIMTTDWQADWGENRLQWIQDHGSIPIVAGLHFDKTIAQINAGQADSLIDAYANRWRDYRFTIVVRLFHEFDYSHLNYTSVGQEAAFVSAWRRIVDRFKARGATNVGFWWCPSEGGNRASADAAYPGDAYVDWVGTDSYNWVFVGEDKYATPWKAGWAEFGEIFDYQAGGGSAPRHDTYGPRKPFVVGETGTVWDPNYPTKKGDWFRNIPAAARNMQYLTGVSFFDIDATPWEDSRNNWIVDHATNVPQVYDGFKTMARDPWFNTRS
jgi:chitodextrinase